MTSLWHFAVLLCAGFETFNEVILAWGATLCAMRQTKRPGPTKQRWALKIKGFCPNTKFIYSRKQSSNWHPPLETGMHVWVGGCNMARHSVNIKDLPAQNNGRSWLNRLPPTKSDVAQVRVWVSASGFSPAYEFGPASCHAPTLQRGRGEQRRRNRQSNMAKAKPNHDNY